MNSKKRKIIFVDDEPKILHGLRRLLRSMRKKWDMKFLESGAEALNYIKSNNIEVIVTDLKMPQMDGATLLEEVKNKYPDIVRIVLSGHAEKNKILKITQTAHQYLSKPCDTEILKSTINRIFNLRNLLSDKRLKELVSQMNVLPSLPSLYKQLSKKIEDPNTSLKEIGKIIQNDISMTTKILHLINSSFFGTYEKITDPIKAVSYLGLENIRTLVLTVKIFSDLKNYNIDIKEIEQLWKHSLEVGKTAKMIASLEDLDQNVIDNSFLAGMLHDLGKLILIVNFPEFYRSVQLKVKENKIPLEEAEKRVFTATHEKVGAYLLALWGIPEPVIQAVAYHHSIDETEISHLNEIMVVHISDFLVNKLDNKSRKPELSEKWLKNNNMFDNLKKWQNLISKDIK